MTAKDRIALISELAHKNKRVFVSELSELCQVTEETIRQDLNKLEKAGLLTRVHGGAIINDQCACDTDDKRSERNGNIGTHFMCRRDVNREQKHIIAAHVVDLIRNNNALFADSSTTVAEVIKLLPENMDITIVTNSTYIFSECAAKNYNIISTGGKFNPKYLSLQGTVAKECISKYNVDVALISCRALDMEHGVQDSNEGDAEIKKQIIPRSKKVILLADHTKFGRTAFVKLMDLDEVDYLITDEDPGDEWRQFCHKHNVQLIY